MKALILAGGYATRLRPLSFTLQKQLLPIVGKPLLYHTIENLQEVGVEEVVLAVNYLSDSLKKEVGKEYYGVKITYSQESTPLGTAGPIRKAKKILSKEDYFLCLNGDIFLQNNLKHLIQLFEKKKPISTIALHEVDNPSRYGVAVFDDEQYIHKFIEKPSKKQIESNYINAGVYLLSKEIFDYIPYGRRVSLEKEIFPVLAQKKSLLGYIHEGAWYDIGKINDYKNANWYLLKTKTFKDQHITPPAFVGSHCTIRARSMVGPYAIIGSGATLGEDVKVTNSILFEKVKTGNSVRIDNTVLGRNVELGNNVVITGDIVIAEGVKITDGVNISGHVNVCPHVMINKDLHGPLNVLFST